MTVSELVEIGRALEELEREAAKKRQADHGGTAPGKPKNTSGKLPEAFDAGDTRDKVGKAIALHIARTTLPPLSLTHRCH